MRNRSICKYENFLGEIVFNSCLLFCCLS